MDTRTVVKVKLNDKQIFLIKNNAQNTQNFETYVKGNGVEITEEEGTAVLHFKSKGIIFNYRRKN